MIIGETILPLEYLQYFDSHPETKPLRGTIEARDQSTEERVH